MDLLLMLAGEEEGPAIILCSVLQALGERAQVAYAPGRTFVKVELELGDLARLPPHAELLASRGRYYIPLDARHARWPLGLLSAPMRGAVRRETSPALSV